MYNNITMNFLIELYKDHKLKINSMVIIVIYTIIYISLIGNYLSDYIDKNWFKDVINLLKTW